MWLKIQECYSASEIYNYDETGLYFCALPEETLCCKNDKLAGSKKSKECLTALLTANMDGLDKLRLFVIGKLAKHAASEEKKTPGNL